MKLNYSFKRFFKFQDLIFTFLVFSFFSLNAYGTMVTISVSSNQFTPNNVSVNVGDSIKWQWINGFHNTSSTTIPPGASAWAALIDNSNPTFIYRIPVAGTYNYECTFHAGMTGQINAAQGSLLIENFDYPAGDSLGAHDWISFSGGSTNRLLVTSPGMVYSGYILSNIGNATRVNGAGQDAYKTLNDSVSTGSLYVSFMVNVTSAQTGDYFFAFLPPTNTQNYTARFYAKDSSGGLAFGLSKSTATSGGIFYTGGNYSFGTTYLVVIKYQFVPGATNDSMYAYIFSSGVPSVEPAAATIGPVTGTLPDNTLGRIALRQGSTTNPPIANIDGFKVSTSWNFSVTSISNYSNNISDNFNLAQNYPNPFNPNTTIKYSIAEKGFINLTVYNSLGEEVSNLVNSNTNAGSYSVDFNGNGLNSGIYFYKLTYTDKSGNNFVDTKKLILLK